jgi:2-amino-4-hydroxy-6-hydroxymethyldihydropteridine diphosphokinase
MTGIWGESLHELFETCKSIEVKAGRPEGHPRYASRPLDIDIIFFGNLVYHDKILTIPHREASERLFVLIPLADVASDWIFPGKDITVAQMLNARKNSPEYEKITDTADSRPQKSSFSQFFTGLS